MTHTVLGIIFLIPVLYKCCQNTSSNVELTGFSPDLFLNLTALHICIQIEYNRKNSQATDQLD